MLAVAAASCGSEVTFTAEGEFGRPIPLASGDASPLPRLYLLDRGCPGREALCADDDRRCGCPDTGPDGCRPILLDSLTPFLTLEAPDQDRSSLGEECIELRAARGLAAPEPTAQDLTFSVTRFRFRDLPLVRAPAGDPEAPFVAGDQSAEFAPIGVVGGNVLARFAWSLRALATEPATVTAYREYPGSERSLADRGLAFLPVQFPGRLLGRDLSDQCDVGGDRCDLPGFHLDLLRRPLTLTAFRMVMDACVAAPPCTVGYTADPADPAAAGTCSRAAGPDGGACIAANDAERGGRSASLVVATSVPGLVLFRAAAVRMFGAPETLPPCASVGDGPACLDGMDGVLHLPGFPSAGVDAPVPRIRVRSIALLPGLPRARGEPACTRMDRRMRALQAQCDRFVTEARAVGGIASTSPPYRPGQDALERQLSADSSLAVIGEAFLATGSATPDPARWVGVHVLPDDHPAALTIRRDVEPEAVEPDGLIGNALVDATELVLDYTDPNPGLRLRCLEPASGACLVAPDCDADGQPACCHGLPTAVVRTMIVQAGARACCGALSAADLEALQTEGHCAGVEPP